MFPPSDTGSKAVAASAAAPDANLPNPTQSLLAEHEHFERLAAVRSALASQRMEGLEPDPRAVADAERWARGEITIGAAVADFKMRVRLEMA